MRLVLVISLWLAGLGAAAQFAKFAVLLPLFLERFPEHATAVGFLVSAISFVGMAFGVVAGALAARAGMRRVLLASLALGAAVSFVQALPLPLFALLATRIVEGLAHLGIVVAAPTLIAEIASDRWRGAAMTLWGTFFGVAFAFAAWAIPVLVARVDLAAVFLAHGAWLFASAILLATLLSRDRGAATPREAYAPRGTASSGLPKARASRLLDAHRAAYASPFVAAPALGWLFYTFTFVSLLAVLPVVLAPQDARLVATLAPLASIASSLTLGVALLRVTSAVGVVLVGFAAAGFIAALLAMQPGGAVLPVVLFAALGLVQGASFAAVPQLNCEPSTRALANGALAQTGNIGNGLGTPVLLSLLSAGSAQTMLVAVVACYAAGIAVHLWCVRRRWSMARAA